MTSDFFIQVLPYPILIWLHFGTEEFIKWSFYLIALPVIFNLIILFLPYFSFGLSLKEKVSKPKPTVVSLKDFNESFKLIYAYARNPKVFSGRTDIQSLINRIDEKIDSLLESNIPKENQTGFESHTSTGNEVGFTRETKSIAKKIKPLKWIFNSLNIAALVLIFTLQIKGFYEYNSLFNKYFVKSSKGYVLNTSEMKKIKDAKTLEKVKKLGNYVDVLNEKKHKNKPK